MGRRPRALANLQRRALPLLEPDARPSASPDPRLCPDAVVRALRPLLSEHRRQRIERVLRHRLLSVTVVLENLHDPHNGGAVLRTCEALGLVQVHVVEHKERFSSSPRVTQRAHKWTGVDRHATVEGCLQQLAGWGYTCWAAVPPPPGERPRAGELVAADRPLALVFGNEHAGLSQQALACCQGRFAIPMFGFTESLNLSVSVAVALQQVTARRRQQLGRPGDLPPAAVDQLRAAYYAASTRYATDVVWRALRGLVHSAPTAG